MLMALTVVLFTTASGCDKAEELANDVKSSVEESMESDSDSVETTETTEVTTPDVKPPPEPVKPKPEELFAEFQSLTPEKVSDAELARVASQPESAAMVTKVETSSPEFSGQGVLLLAKLENLASVNIANGVLRAQDLAGLGNAKSLKSVSISSSAADDSVVASLASLPELESLDLSSTKVSPAAGVSFSQMIKLAELDLRHTKINDTLVASVAGLPIRKLDLAQTQITDEILPLLFKIKTLEELDVSFNRLNGAAFEGISSTGIRVLNVGETNFGVPGFMNIKGMRQLEELNVYNAGLVQHKKADVFTSFPRLKVLNAGKNAIADAGVDEFFRGHRTLERLRLHNCRGITNNGLGSLVGLRKLKFLDVTGTLCNGQGAMALKQKLPDCEIHCADGTF